jgi:cytidine deaminase
MDYSLLVEKARGAMAFAYAPYSSFKVGAALRTSSGVVYTGCNIENVSFGATVCAERVAFLKAISEGVRSFEAIAVVNSSPDIVFPCGICLQFMAEFGGNLVVAVANQKEIKTFLLKDLMPYAFSSFKV